MPNSSLFPNTDNVQIRPATPADILRIRQLEEQTLTAAHWTQTQYDSLFAPDAPARAVLVATDEPSQLPIAGFLVSLCLPDEWEIENVVVEVPERRKGLGSLLIRELLNQAEIAGAVSVILEVRESNAPAVQLYEKLGFKIEGRRPAYYQYPVEDALLYRFPLQKCDKMP
jgi:[ribosomal protein S18]-alanine N-acetyltransferase